MAYWVLVLHSVYKCTKIGNLIISCSRYIATGKVRFILEIFMLRKLRIMLEITIKCNKIIIITIMCLSEIFF